MMATADDQSKEARRMQEWLDAREEKEHGVDQAWRILAQETGRKGGTADRLKHFVAGGELVRRLNWAHKHKLSTWMIRQRGTSTFNREQVAWSWDAGAETMRKLIDQTVFVALQAGEQTGHRRIGVPLIFDTEMVENAELEEVQSALMGMKIRVDTQNEERQTDHYVMVAQCLY